MVDDNAIKDRADAAEAREGWKEAAIAWSVCASIHEKFGKKRDALYTTRQADFVKDRDKARAKVAALSPPAQQEVEPRAAKLDARYMPVRTDEVIIEQTSTDQGTSAEVRVTNLEDVLRDVIESFAGLMEHDPLPRELEAWQRARAALSPPAQQEPPKP